LIEANGTLEINEPLMFPSNEWKQNLFKDFEQKSNEIDNHYASMMASLQKEKDQKVNSLMISMTLRIY